MDGEEEEASPLLQRDKARKKQRTSIRIDSVAS